MKDQKGGEDGYLQMKEVEKLNLRAEFVNLSACQTGLGAVYGGEGVIGLAQAFFLAGTRSLSVTLWNVADRSTSLFMTALYEAVAKDGLSYSQAISKAKQKFARGDFGETYRRPFYWAPFVYYGP